MKLFLSWIKRQNHNTVRSGPCNRLIIIPAMSFSYLIRKYQACKYGVWIMGKVTSDLSSAGYWACLYRMTDAKYDLLSVRGLIGSVHI